MAKSSEELPPRRARELGMDRPISRRDFLDGVALTAAGAALGSVAAGVGAAVVSEAPPEYPPILQGLRGNTPDALGVAHALRDGRFWEHAGAPESTGERYDLVVVGAGISGITAAYRWWRRDPRARVLILDNHDDVGGRARRNEFRPSGGNGPLVGYGGSPRLPAPLALTAESRDLLDELGVRVDAIDQDARHPIRGESHDGVFCDRETFAEEKLVVLNSTENWITELPVGRTATRDLITLVARPPDWFPGLSDEEKKRKLAGLSYTAFLREVCGVHEEVIRFCRTMPSRDRGCGSDALSAVDAWACADRHLFPGFDGLRLDRSQPSRYNSPSVIRTWGAGPELQYFPEGNHALIRMMIRRMIPDLSRFDYALLDRRDGRVRVRLSSPAVLVRNNGSPDRATSATVGYFDGERVSTVQAGAVVLACWHSMIPYLVPDLPGDQRTALTHAVRAPLISATVQLRHGRCWRRAGVGRVRFTGAYWTNAEPGRAVHGDPDQPITVQLARFPAKPDLPPRAAAVAGRNELLATPYAFMEYSVRDQLTRLLGPAGFDPARDIEGLTVNRWGYGRAMEYARPFDAFYPDGPFPAETASRRFGRIAIAGSDSVPGPAADTAITSAWRAVDELAT